MSLFDNEINTNAEAAPSQGTAGAKTGFGANYEAAYNDMYHVRSAFGADEDMANLEQQQLDNLFRLTGQRMEPLFPGTYAGTGPSKQERFALLHSLAGDQAEGQPPVAVDMQKQIDQMSEAAARYPGLLTYDQMFDQVKKNAAHNVEDAADVGARSTFAGAIGGFAGAAVGGFTPRDPINMASLALGGFGKTAVARVASMAGITALSQAVELMTGSYENQKLLGQAPTEGEMAAQVAGAGLSGGVFQAGGEAIGAGFRAIVSHFGANAPDIAAGALAKEAEDAIGPSRYGTSRSAEGLHTGEVLDALSKDAPLNIPGLKSGAPEFTAGSLAGRESDKLFAGTSEPLANIFGKLPAATSQKIAEANKALTEMTDRIGVTDEVASKLDQEIAAKKAGAVDNGQIFRDRAKVADLARQMEGETNARKLGSLSRDKAALETSLARAEAVNADLQSLVSKREGVSQISDQLRLNRSQIVSDVANKVKGVKKGAVGQDLASTAGPERPRPVDQKVATATPSADVEKSLTEAPPAEGPKAKIVPPPEPKEGEAPAVKAGEAGSGETVDIGQHGEPISLDHPVITGHDADGKPIVSSIRDILQDHKDDDSLVRQMKECLI